MFRTETLPEAEIFEVLANRRRRETIRCLTVNAAGGPLSLRELSERIAIHETSESPPPEPVRESVYNALHQTHLPKLEALDVVSYDRDTCEIRLCEQARDVDRYTQVLAGGGLTWSELYRTLGVVSLTFVVAALADVAVVSAVAPLVWATCSLLAFALATSYQLWSSRWYLVQTLKR